MLRNKLITTLSAIAMASTIEIGTAAADYPDQPITFIIPASPGGTTDVGVRTFMPYFEKCIGGTTTILYKPGAKNKIGFTELALSKPDGYTLGALTMPNVVVAEIEGGVKFSTASFEPLGSFFASAQTISVAKDSPYQSFQQLVENSKATNTPIMIGLSEFGSDDHFLGLRLAKMGGLNIKFIPFGDAALARNAVLGRQVDIGLISVTEAMPFQDQLRTLAVSSTERFSGLPDVPSLTELGYKLGEVGSRHVIGAPAGIPDDVRQKIVACLDQIPTDPNFLKDAEQRSLIVSPMNAKTVTDFIQSELGVFKELWASDPWK